MPENNKDESPTEKSKKPSKIDKEEAITPKGKEITEAYEEIKELHQEESSAVKEAEQSDEPKANCIKEDHGKKLIQADTKPSSETALDSKLIECADSSMQIEMREPIVKIKEIDNKEAGDQLPDKENNTQDVNCRDQILEQQSTEKQVEPNDTPAIIETVEAKKNLSDEQEKPVETHTEPTQSPTAETYSRRNKRIESIQEDSKQYYYQQRSFEHRRYQNFSYNRHSKKPLVRYVYKQPRRIYQRKAKPPAPENSASFTEQSESVIKEEQEQAVPECNDALIANEVLKKEETNPTIEESKESTLVKEESVEKEDAKQKESPIEEEKMGGDESREVRRKETGLGGVVLETNEDEADESISGTSPRDSCEQIKGDEKEMNEITLLEAFNYANSLLGYRTLYSESKQVASKLSPLSELRDNSIEYKPNYN
eukprot:TRINITY_DN9762_c0_g1_i9.p1 TRINITY_DN9762_c0_g1~~TRINITY_DN9762_c0_g1_i9.p1  ORF type:complete len:427 (-),score=105.90 TRINITY_DN9762_c0_g1_i9:110-1390(-)